MPRPRTLRALLDRGEVALGSFAYLSDPATVEIMAAAGMDFVVIDMEHTALDLGQVLALVRASHGAGIAPVVRIPSMDPKLVLRVLEMGTDGVMLPSIRNAEEARALVASIKYPPHGDRGSCRVVRASEWGSFNDSWPAYVDAANADLLAFGLVEDQAAAEEMDEIVACLDATFVGRADLSADLGVPGEMQHPLVEAVAVRHEETSQRLGKPAGCLVHSPEDAQAKIEAGYRLVMYAMDVKVLADGFSSWVRQVRQDMPALPAQPNA